MLELIRPETIGDAAQNARLQALVRYWNAKRAGGSMPSRQQIEPIEIPRLLPIVLIADATVAGARIRLLGTEATAAYGQETHGKCVDEFELGEFMPFWLKAFALVTQSGKPVSAGGSFHKESQLRRILTVLMPLSDDGLSISHIFGGLLIRPTPWSSSIIQEAPTPYLHLARTG